MSECLRELSEEFTSELKSKSFGDKITMDFRSYEFKTFLQILKISTYLILHNTSQFCWVADN